MAADVCRLVGKPETFSNDKAAFPKWSFVMVSYISAMSNDMGRLMVEVGDQPERIILVGLAVDSRPYAAQLFHALTMLCKEESLETIMVSRGVIASKLGGSSSGKIDRGTMR